MFRKLLLLATFLTFGLFASGQSELPAVVTSIDGKVKYSPRERGCMKSLKSGTALLEEGRVKIKEGSSMKVFFDGKYLTFSEPGKQSVSNLLPPRESGMAGGFASDFGNFVLAAAGGGGTPPPPPPRDKTGWGEKDFQLIMPAGGKVEATEIRFVWKEVKDLDGYTFHLFPSGSDEALLTRDVSGTSLTLNLRDSGLTPGNSYTWMVSARNDPTRKSAGASFAYTRPAEKDRLLGQLKGMESYQQGGPADKGLMEAFLLARGEFFSAANTLYRKLIQLNPKNELVKKSYWRFLIDNELESLAGEVK